MWWRARDPRRPQRGWCTVLALIGFVWLGMSVAPAAAQPAPAQGSALSARDQARTLANRGYELYQASQYDQALRYFLQAEQLFHAPTLVLQIALCREQLGQLAAAEAEFRRVAEEPLAADAPVEFGQAQQEARAGLARVGPRVGRLDLVLRGPRAAQRVAVTIDGARVPPERLAGSLAVDPGRHTVVVRAPGVSPLESTIDWTPGQRVQLEYEVPPEPGIDADYPPRPPSPSGADTEAPSDPLLVPAIVATGVAVLGAVVGTAAGIVALNKQAELEDVCPTKSCRPEDEDLADAATTNATVSTVGFVFAAVGAATAVTLFALGGSSEPAEPGAASARLELGPAAVRLRGAFW